MNNFLSKPEAMLPTNGLTGKVVHYDIKTICEMHENLTENGEFRILPAKEWLKYGKNNLCMFLNAFHIWVVPTLELIDILDDEIGDLSCVEICAGLGIIGKELGITTTDSHLHASEEYRNATKDVMGNIPDMFYPSYVQKFEASEAVDEFRPECVLGCYAVPKWTEEKARKYYFEHGKELQGSMVGVDYDYILPKVKKLILVGHKALYNQYSFFKRRHRVIINKNILTRHSIEGQSGIYVFENN